MKQEAVHVTVCLTKTEIHDSGGELFDRITADKNFTEAQAAVH